MFNNTSEHSSTRTRENQKYWDGIAAIYDNLYQQRWDELENAFVQETLQWIKEMPSPKVLDLGCGTGMGYELLKAVNSAVRYTGIDFAPKMIKVFSRKHKDVQLVVGDMAALPFKKQEFDAVVSFFGSPSYAASLRSILDVAGRVIKPGGYIRLSVFNKTALRRLLTLRAGKRRENYGTGHLSASHSAAITTYTIRELKELAALYGWEIVRLDTFSIFARLLEHPGLWRLDRSLNRVVPQLAHTIDIVFKIPL